MLFFPNGDMAFCPHPSRCLPPPPHRTASGTRSGNRFIALFACVAFCMVLLTTTTYSLPAVALAGYALWRCGIRWRATLPRTYAHTYLVRFNTLPCKRHLVLLPCCSGAPPYAHCVLPLLPTTPTPRNLPACHTPRTLYVCASTITT